MPSRLLLSSVAVGAVAIGGCGVAATEAADAEVASQSATAVVVVERTPVGDSVVARFVRAKQGAVDEATLRSAGIALDLPASGCMTVEAPRAAARSVALVDVGPVTLESATSKTALLPKEMPDPSGIVSGFYYSARTNEAFSAGAPVQIHAPGGVEADGFAIDGFTVSVPAPNEVANVQVVSTAQGLDVSWDANDDLVYIDILNGTAGRSLTRCVAEGSRALVQTNLEQGEIAVHRVHREAFRTKGIDPGEVRFDVSKNISFSR